MGKKPMLTEEDVKRKIRVSAGLEEPLTEPVTRPKPTAWEEVGLTKAEWDGLDIPPMFIRTEEGDRGKREKRDADRRQSLVEASAKVQQAGVLETGTQSVEEDHFAKYRVDPDEVERKIIAEADRLWRDWVPNKKDLDKRPRLSAFVRRVRKDYYK